MRKPHRVLPQRVRWALECIAFGHLLNAGAVEGLTDAEARMPENALAWLFAHAILARDVDRITNAMTPRERVLFERELTHPSTGDDTTP